MSEQEYILKINSFSDKDEKESFIYPLILQSIDKDSFLNSEPTYEFHIFLELIEYWLNLNIDVKILSSIMKPNGKNDEIKRQKQLWLIKNNLDFLPQHFVLGSKLKKEFAVENSLLIDDFYKNIEQWHNINLKQYAILHTNINDTLRQLKNYRLLKNERY